MKMMNFLKKLAREPLLHFLVLAAALFVAYSFVSKGSSDEGGKIVITQGQLASMWESFTQTRQREPTRDEWEGLIRERVKEEVYYREALALGMDKDDLIIRRRLQQKMEFVSDDVSAQAQPTDDELRAYLQAHPDSFRIDPRFTFRQVYLNPEKHGKSLAPDTALLLAKLKQEGSKADISALGDSIIAGKAVRRAAGQGGRAPLWREVRGRVGRTSAWPMARTDRIRLRRASGIREPTPGRVGACARGRARWRTP